MALLTGSLAAEERVGPGPIAAGIDAALAATAGGDLGPASLCRSNCALLEARDDQPPFVGAWGARGLGLGIGFGAGFAFGNGARAGRATALRGGWRAGDSAVAGVTLALWGATRLFDEAPPRPWGGPGSEDGLNALDRSIAKALGGGRGRLNAAAVSDVTLLAAASLASGLVASGRPDARGRDLAVVGGTLLVNAALVDAVKRLADRPRPYAHFCRPYRPEDLCDPHLHSSFYSGHASTAFSMAVAAGMLSHYHGYRNEAWVWASGLTLATTTGVLRIVADKHYFTDVIAGAAAGALVGWLVPRLHRPEKAEALAFEGASEPPFAGALSLPVRLRGVPGQAALGAGFAGGFSLRASWQW